MIMIGFIGCGNMGGALAAAAAKYKDAEIRLFDKDEDKAKALAERIGGIVCDIDGVCACELVFLGVKPNIIPIVADEIAKKVAASGATVISMAAGIPLAKLAVMLGDLPIIRIMPNTPAEVGYGMILYTANEKGAGAVPLFLESMAAAGKFDAIDERLIDAASAISGCGPAFVYMFIEALADGGVMSGLSRDKAMLYAAETLIGAAEVVKQTGRHPGALKDAVCSPGGSTIEGVKALEDGKMRGTVSGAVVASYEKTLKLGK
ncbi:MAG: pyrroline-5-carboxylate reductase [Clostridia bacterium]|nr:pyrroline-5-carboxylate reductase [Clostridia bacterium]